MGLNERLARIAAAVCYRRTARVGQLMRHPIEDWPRLVDYLGRDTAFDLIDPPAELR